MVMWAIAVNSLFWKESYSKSTVAVWRYSILTEGRLRETWDSDQYVSSTIPGKLKSTFHEIAVDLFAVIDKQERAGGAGTELMK
ncbi:uncharacterized protein CCR75_006187 [Bremia lactucae]|uniref:Uncharacterized protein n=1 Tax=Bremia lactucae TaxID=4779 RepID=A0A976FGH7_BRELC|nr:hypothetical protein CCR75_006187 [Bremia lactucae]